MKGKTAYCLLEIMEGSDDPIEGIYLYEDEKERDKGYEAGVALDDRIGEKKRTWYKCKAVIR